MTKNVTYYKFVADDSVNDIVINYYPTTHAIDIRLKGSNKEASMFFHDKDSKTAAGFIATKVIPELIRHINMNYDIEKYKNTWKNLAIKGLNFERKKIG